MWLTADELIADWVGDDVPTATDDTLERWIGKAERFLLFEFPTLEERLAAGKEPHLLDNVKDVVSAMVTRVLRNPHGYRSLQRQVGAASESTTFGGDQPGTLMLTDRERAMISEPGLGRGRAYSVSLGGNNDLTHSESCTWNMGGSRCSCGAIIAGEPIYGVIS